MVCSPSTAAPLRRRGRPSSPIRMVTSVTLSTRPRWTPTSATASSSGPTGATATVPGWIRWTASWRPWRQPEQARAETCYPVSTMEKTIKEAATLLGKSPRVLQQMCRDGKVPARREGRGWLVDVSGLVPGGRRRRSAERPPPAECPRQQAVANRAGEILDIFSAGFSGLAREERLAAYIPAEDAGARWRNAVRMTALGMVVRLGRDLGLATNDLHGDERLRGRTQVPELQSVQRTTSLSALRMCDAM